MEVCSYWTIVLEGGRSEVKGIDHLQLHKSKNQKKRYSCCLQMRLQIKKWQGLRTTFKQESRENTNVFVCTMFAQITWNLPDRLPIRWAVSLWLIMWGRSRLPHHLWILVTLPSDLSSLTVSSWASAVAKGQSESEVAAMRFSTSCYWLCSA